jgi:BASS family bile acid:Na+ symporter
MAAASIIQLGMILSLWLVVLSLGARATPRDAMYVIAHPGLLFRALLTLFVLVPALAFAIALIFPLSPYIKLALVALAVSPVPPILPAKQLKSGASESYAIGLLVAAAAAAVILTPLLIYIASMVFARDVAMPPVQVAKTLVITIAVPLIAGIALRYLAPAFAERTQRYAFIVGATLLLLAIGLILVKNWSGVTALVGNGSILAIAALVVFGLIAGRLLSGQDRANSDALALAAATRHPGVALAIVSANFPEYREQAIGAILLFILTNAVITGGYLALTKRRRTRDAGQQSAAASA